MGQETFTRKSYTFPLKATGGAIGQEFANLPWVAVRRANVLVGLADDIDVNPATAGNLVPQMMIGLEVTIVGLIQGFETTLKRQFMTGRTGPMRYVFADEDAFEYISFRQRMMNGGRPLTPPFGSNPAAAAALATVTANIYVLPRTGYKDVTNG